MSQRVVITGIGCVSPLGCTPEKLWQALLHGRTAVDHISLFDASAFPVQIAAEVRDWDISLFGEDPRQWQDWPRQTQFAVAAGLAAGRDAGLSADQLEPRRVGVFLGCGEVFPEFNRFARCVSSAVGQGAFRMDEFQRDYYRDASAQDDERFEPGAAIRFIASEFDAQGPCQNYTTACVSSSAAVGEAMDAIRRGDADVMLAGGAHSMVHPLGVTGLHRIGALSTHNNPPEQAYRSFDRHRDGFVIGEGGVVFALEELEHARRRGAQILGELRGYGTNHDAFRVTDVRPDGSVAGECIRLALRDARLDPDDIGYVNAHGSGTPLNDRAETAAVKRAMGQHAYRVPISSTKGMTGHLTTACGSLELLVCLLAVRTGMIPPTVNYQTPDPDCDLDYVPNQSRQVKLTHALNNNFGFGGNNVSLVVSQFTN